LLDSMLAPWPATHWHGACTHLFSDLSGISVEL